MGTTEWEAMKVRIHGMRNKRSADQMMNNGGIVIRRVE